MTRTLINVLEGDLSFLVKEILKHGILQVVKAQRIHKRQHTRNPRRWIVKPFS